MVVKYISSREMSENSEQRDSWLNSGHQTLDADILTFSKGIEKDRWRTQCINHGQQAPVRNLGKDS